MDFIKTYPTKSLHQLRNNVLSSLVSENSSTNKDKEETIRVLLYQLTAVSKEIGKRLLSDTK